MFNVDFLLFRCLNDVKTAVWISIVPGLTTGVDLEVLLENSGLVRATV